MNFIKYIKEKLKDNKKLKYIYYEIMQLVFIITIFALSVLALLSSICLLLFIGFLICLFVIYVSINILLKIFNKSFSENTFFYTEDFLFEKISEEKRDTKNNLDDAINSMADDLFKAGAIDKKTYEDIKI